MELLKAPSSFPVTRSVTESEVDESVRSLADDNTPPDEEDNNDITTKGLISMKVTALARQSQIKRYSTKLFNVEKFTNENKRRIGFVSNKVHIRLQVKQARQKVRISNMMYSQLNLKLLNKQEHKDLSFEQQYQFLLDEKELEDIYEIGEILGSPAKINYEQVRKIIKYIIEKQPNLAPQF